MKINLKEVTIVTACPCCGEANFIEANESDYWDWKDGALVQDAFPYLTPNEREALISGLCPWCWEQTFGKEENEDEFPDDPTDEMGFNPYLGCYDFDC